MSTMPSDRRGAEPQCSDDFLSRPEYAEVSREVRTAPPRYRNEIGKYSIHRSSHCATCGRCVEICTGAALKEMIAPSIMSIIAPIAIGLVMGRYALGGFLIGSLATGFILAVTLNNAGGAWDNAKKFIEAGNFGGKGWDAYKAAGSGDTTGDPMEDTAGPSLNIQLKLMAVISLLLAPVLIGFPGLF